MKVLSLISFFNAYTLVVCGIYILRVNPKDALRRLVALINLCFAIWCFAYTFFYSAPGEAGALFWHRVSSVGWLFFIPLGAHSCLELIGETKKPWTWFWYALVYSVPLVLLINTFLSAQTPFARGFVQSGIGWGWTYVSNIHSLWCWLYLTYIGITTGVFLVLLYRWANRSARPLYIRISGMVILLVPVLIVLGIFTDIYLPSVTNLIPPVLNTFSVIVGAVSIMMINRYRLMSVEAAVSSDLIVETVMEPILMVNNHGYIVKCNKAVTSLLKYQMENIIGRRLSDFYKIEDFQPRELENLMDNKMISGVEVDLVDSRGSIINTVASFSVVETKLDGFIGVVISLHDVTEYKELNNSLEKLANYDKLTALPNRRMFFDRFESLIDHYNELGRKFAVVYLDLDGFKAVNDTYGHVVGDKLLEKIADILSVETRKEDTMARIGGDEFVMLFEGLDDESELEEIVERLRNLFPGPVSIGNIKCKIGISVGVSKCPEDGTSIDMLLKTADQRMYRDKTARNGQDIL